MDEPGFKAIERGEQRGFGPRAVLVCGFSQAEADALRLFLDQIGIADARLSLVSEAMLAMNLGQALQAEQGQDAIAMDKLPRVLIFSGLSGGEATP
ncbi:MAG: hypothetical protein P9M14_11035 [Candidatus Alcyoniella australis]|nr:hypothetical protein [Candidatus Alcyoniella australis]